MEIAAIVVAAGLGRRMGGAAKALLELCGKPLLCHSLDLFQSSPLVDGIVVAVPPGTLSFFRDEFASRWRHPKVLAWVAGGARRQDSAAAALAAVPPEASIVAVHDAARPCASAGLVRRVIEAAKRSGAAIPAVEVVDTIKEVDEAGVVTRSPARERLRAVQTPQAFSAGLLREAYRAAGDGRRAATDDASLVERLGRPVVVVEGERGNIKITVPEDLGAAEAILKGRMGGGAGPGGAGPGPRIST